MTSAYVHGYDPREHLRLQDQASTLVELLHSDTAYPFNPVDWALFPVGGLVTATVYWILVNKPSRRDGQRPG